MRRRCFRSAVATAVASALLAASGCGVQVQSDAATATDAETTAERSGPAGSAAAVERPGTTASAPFAVGDVPVGYELVEAGLGRRNIERAGGAVTVLAPPGPYVDPALSVRVTARPLGDDVEADLARLTADGRSEGSPFQVDGAPGAHRAARAEGEFSVVAVARDDVALVVEGVAGRDELAAVAAAAEPAEGGVRLAPVVADPPAGLEVVGSLDAVVAAVVGLPALGDRGVAGAPSGLHTATWTEPNRGATLSVVSLPGAAGDLDGFLGIGDPGGAYVVPGADTGTRDIAELRLPLTGPGRRVAATVDRVGNLFVVIAHPGSGDDPIPSDYLAATAGSITTVDDDTWEAIASGDPDAGQPELGAGQEEIARSDGPDGWLLATADGVDGTELGRQASPCVQLVPVQEACAPVRWSAPDQVVSIIDPDGVEAAGVAGRQPFLVVSYRGTGAELRLTVGPSTSRAALHPVPGTTDVVAGVLFLGDVPSYDGLATATFSCDPARTTETTTTTFSYDGVPRLDVLDAAGQAVGCLAP